MHLAVHLASAVPFLVVGNYAAAAGCVLPDLTWSVMEYRFRRSGVTNWYEWSKTITDRQLIPYRSVHSFLIVGILWALFGSYTTLFYGWLVHILLDLPTHWGLMTPMPLYPIKWRWTYVFRHIKARYEN